MDEATAAAIGRGREEVTRKIRLSRVIANVKGLELKAELLGMAAAREQAARVIHVLDSELLSGGSHAAAASQSQGRSQERQPSFSTAATAAATAAAAARSRDSSKTVYESAGTCVCVC